MVTFDLLKYKMAKAVAFGQVGQVLHARVYLIVCKIFLAIEIQNLSCSARSFIMYRERCSYRKRRLQGPKCLFLVI